MKVQGPDGKIVVFPDGTPPDTVKAAMARHYGSPSPAPAEATATSDPFADAQLRRRALGMLPTAGGLAGGLIGGALGAPMGPAGILAGGVRGAGLGGAIGELGREAALRQPLSGVDIARQGVGQGLLEVGGQVVGLGARAFGKGLMERSLGIVPTLARRFKMKPQQIAEIVLGKRLPVSIAGEEAAAGMGMAIRRARGASIAATPGTVTSQTIAKVAIRDAQAQLGRPLKMSERRILIARVEAEADAILTARTHGAVPKTGLPTPSQPASQVLNQYGQPAIPARASIPAPPSRYTARELNQIKMVAAKHARLAYRAEQAALSVSADPELSKQVAQGARARLNQIPGVEGQSGRIKDLMAARLGISQALERGSSEWAGLHVPFTPFSLGVKVPRDKMSHLALFLTGRKFQALLRQSPRAAAALITEMTQAQPDVTAAP